MEGHNPQSSVGQVTSKTEIKIIWKFLCRVMCCTTSGQEDASAFVKPSFFLCFHGEEERSIFTSTPSINPLAFYKTHNSLCFSYTLLLGSLKPTVPEAVPRSCHVGRKNPKRGSNQSLQLATQHEAAISSSTRKKLQGVSTATNTPNKRSAAQLMFIWVRQWNAKSVTGSDKQI